MLQIKKKFLLMIALLASTGLQAQLKFNAILKNLETMSSVVDHIDKQKTTKDLMNGILSNEELELWVKEKATRERLLETEKIGGTKLSHCIFCYLASLSHFIDLIKEGYNAEIIANFQKWDKRTKSLAENILKEEENDKAAKEAFLSDELNARWEIINTQNEEQKSLDRALWWRNALPKMLAYAEEIFLVADDLTEEFVNKNKAKYTILLNKLNNAWEKGYQNSEKADEKEIFINFYNLCVIYHTFLVQHRLERKTCDVTLDAVKQKAEAVKELINQYLSHDSRNAKELRTLAQQRADYEAGRTERSKRALEERRRLEAQKAAETPVQLAPVPPVQGPAQPVSGEGAVPPAPAPAPVPAQPVSASDAKPVESLSQQNYAALEKVFNAVTITETNLPGLRKLHEAYEPSTHGTFPLPAPVPGDVPTGPTPTPTPAEAAKSNIFASHPALTAGAGLAGLIAIVIAAKNWLFAPTSKGKKAAAATSLRSPARGSVVVLPQPKSRAGQPKTGLRRPVTISR